MAENPYISKITLPSGNTYDIKDATAREAIAALEGGSYFLGITSTEIHDGSTLATISIGGVDTTATNGNIAIYGKKEFIFDGTKWSEFGDLEALKLTTATTNVLGAGTTLTNSTSAVTFSGGTTDKVLGEATTFALTNGAITHGTPTTDSVLGADTVFAASAPSVSLGGSTKYLSASAIGANTTWSSKDQKEVVTGYTSPTTDTFVKSVAAETNKKLVITSITPTNGTETVSKVTQTASKLVTTSVPNVTGNSDVTIPNVTSIGSASNWSFAMGTGTDNETLIISGGNGTAPTLGTALSASKVTLGTAITAATGAVDSNGSGSDIVTSVSVSDKTVAKAGSAMNVATGDTATDGTGAAIVTGVTIGESASALTGLGTPATATVIGSSSTFNTTQPTISLTANAETANGRITYLESATPTATAPTISVSTPDVVSAVTGMPTSTVGTAITVGTNDKVTAITGVGTGTAAAQSITIGNNDIVAAITTAELTEETTTNP